MTIRTCCAPGCGARTSRYGRFCSSHRTRLRRHGHQDQEAVTKADLALSLKLVRARIQKNAESPLWAQCEARWAAVLEHARSILASFARKEAGYRCERIAAQEVVKLADHVEPRAVLETAFAVYLLQDHQPHRFKSDAAFRTQLVRRLRGLTDVNAGEWFNHKTGRTHRAYREMTPRAVASMAAWIGEALGPIGLYLAKLDQNERQAKQQEKDALQVAVSALC